MSERKLTTLADAERLYAEGNEYRRQGLWHEAINCYNMALEIDSGSPAKVAKEMLESILDFRCKDYYNP